MSRKVNFKQVEKYEPERCWVEEAHKISYKTREEAEMAARVVEHDHGLKGLSVYKCEFGEHWHLSSK